MHEHCQACGGMIGRDCFNPQECAEITAQMQAQPYTDPDVERDAARFRALMRCGRIKMQGSSGVDPHTGERNGSNVHFGAEFWPEPASPEFTEHYAKGTAWGRACLRHLADAILEHEAQASA